MPSMQQMVGEGTACYRSGDVIAAARHFKQAAKSCKCAVNQANLECKCVDFLQACHDHKLSEILRQPCTCPRRAAKRCKDESHSVALASLVLISIKTKDYKSGLIVSQNLIRIAPRDPRGYLRLGQLLRLTKKHTTALAVYQQGIALVARANPQHPGLGALQEQEKIISKALRGIDPVNVLPTELFIQVLRNLHTADYCGILRVSKTWKTFIERTWGLWTEQYFPDTKKAGNKFVPARTIQKYHVTYPGGQLKSLTIMNCGMFPHLFNKLGAVLRACPELQHLFLHGYAFQEEAFNFPQPYKGPQLRTLHISSDDRSSTGFELMKFLAPNNSETLENLSLLGLRDIGQALNLNGTGEPRLYPRLEILRLSGNIDGASRNCVSLSRIAHVAPNIQRLSLGRMVLGSAEGQDDSTIPQWPHLKSFSCTETAPYSSLDSRMPPLPEALEEFVLFENPFTYIFVHGSEESLDWGHLVNQAPQQPKPYFPGLKRIVIKSLHRRSLSNEDWKSLIAPSVTNDTLRILDIHPFPWHLMHDLNITRQWLAPETDATGITALAISCLMAAVGHEIDSADDALLRLVQLFPNLRDLDIGSEPVELSTLGRIFDGGVERIYHQQGARMLDLKDWARSNNKDVIQGSMTEFRFGIPES